MLYWVRPFYRLQYFEGETDKESDCARLESFYRAKRWSLDHSFPPHLLYLYFCLCPRARHEKLIKKQGKAFPKVHIDLDNSCSSVAADDIEPRSQQLHSLPPEEENIRQRTQKDPPWRQSKHDCL